jgi:hypothetical protein
MPSRDPRRNLIISAKVLAIKSYFISLKTTTTGRLQRKIIYMKNNLMYKHHKIKIKKLNTLQKAPDFFKKIDHFGLMR